MSINDDSYIDAHLHLKSGTQPVISDQVVSVFLNSTGKADLMDIDNYALNNTLRHNDSIIPFFGLHPWNCSEESVDTVEISGFTEKHMQKGIGECGLDFGNRYKSYRNKQLVEFEKQLKLAADLQLPLSIHCVRAWGSMLEILKKYAPFRVPFILHSFYGPAEVFRQLLEFGGFISLSSLSFRNPEKSGPVIRQIPFERILIETDLLAGSSDFSTENHFNILLNNYKTVAEIKSIPVKEFISGVYENGKVFQN